MRLREQEFRDTQLAVPVQMQILRREAIMCVHHFGCMLLSSLVQLLLHLLSCDQGDRELHHGHLI
jgi:hypothetical protein